MKAKVFHIRLAKDHLQIDQDNFNKFLESVAIKKTATELIAGSPNFWSILVFYEDQKTEKDKTKSGKITVFTEDELTEVEKRIYEALKKWRYDMATQLNIPSFMICHNTELMTIAKVKPENLDDFSKIKGFGNQKTAKLGDDIIALLNSI